MKIAAGHEVKHKAAMSKAGEGVVRLYLYQQDTASLFVNLICVYTGLPGKEETMSLVQIFACLAQPQAASGYGSYRYAA